MFDTHQTVVSFLEAVLPDFIDHAYSYGEPGYETDDTATTPMVVLGNYWCRCGKPDDLHGIDTHYPQTFARLESQGVELVWYDEWTVDHENESKAYRVTGDSYSWKPSLVVTDDGEYLTPDDELDTWLDYMVNEPTRCIPGHIYSGADLETAGFTKHNGRFENGWHPGQDDDPTAIDADIRELHGRVDVVFVLDGNGQFDLEFSAYFRPAEDDDS